MKRRDLLRGLAALPVAVAVGSMASAAPAPTPDETPGWAEEWPPSAHPKALVVTTAADEVCRKCGQCHGYLTRGCVPVAFVPELWRDDAAPGVSFGGASVYVVPQLGTLVEQMDYHGESRLAVVRESAWQFTPAPLHPYQDADPLIHPGTWTCA